MVLDSACFRHVGSQAGPGEEPEELEEPGTISAPPQCPDEESWQRQGHLGCGWVIQRRKAQEKELLELRRFPLQLIFHQIALATLLPPQGPDMSERGPQGGEGCAQSLARQI